MFFPNAGGGLTEPVTFTQNVTVNKNLILKEYAIDYASAITPDFANGLVQTVTVTGTMSINLCANPADTSTMLIYVVQDATGSRAVTLNASYKTAGGTAPTFSTAANARDLCRVTIDESGNQNFAILELDIK